MGCLGSKAEANREKLSCLERAVQRSVCGPGPGGLAQELEALEGWAQELRDLFDFFERRRDMAELERIQRISDSMTQQLCGLLDVDLIRRGDPTAVRRILSVAHNLDKVRATKASALIDQKHRELQMVLGTDQLREVAELLRVLELPKLLEGSKLVLSVLQYANVFVAEVPELLPPMLGYCTAFAVKVLELLQSAPELHPGTFWELMDVGANLDAMCSALADRRHAVWEPLVPKVAEIRAHRATELVPLKLEALEAELAKPSGMNQALLIRVLADIGFLWVSPSPELESRLAHVTAAISARVTEAFDRALAAGESAKIDALSLYAGEFDAARATFHGGSAKDLLTATLKQRRAGVTLKHLLANAEGSVSRQSEALHASWVDAEARVRRVPREDLEERAQGPRWRFKLNRGGFKDFSPEKSAEVEGLYQAWLARGKPSNDRSEIAIEVDGSASRRPAARGAAERMDHAEHRPRCRYGEGCYQKNVEHRRRYCHPIDWDWDHDHDADGANPSVSDTEAIRPPSAPPAAPDSELPTVGTSSLPRQERFSLDFSLMTQKNLSSDGRGMRSINRVEGLTVAQKHTHEYFALLTSFVKEYENTLSQAEVELHLLGAAEREQMQQQIDALVQAMGPSLREFLVLAVLVRDMKVIDEVVASLGAHAECLGLEESLKGLRLSDGLGELRQAYAEQRPQPLGQWELVRRMCKRQSSGPKSLLGCRLALVKTKQEFWTLTRRRVQMRCQALLSEYAGDEEFAMQFREEAVKILEAALVSSAKPLQFDVAGGILRTAASWQCDIRRLADVAGEAVAATFDLACRSRQPLTRASEVLDSAQELARAAQRKSVWDLCDVGPSIPVAAEKAVLGVQACLQWDGARADHARRLSGSTKTVVEFRTKLVLGSDTAGAAFDSNFWNRFKSWYEEAASTASTETQSGLVEWAIAFCEQCLMPLPPWMMDKDQVEALRKLQHALDSGDEQLLREAVIFAKQTDLRSDATLCAMCDDALEQLRKLKRLPSGWGVSELVGDDPTATMFAKMDMTNPELKILFQELFDETRSSISTRDRKGEVPKGYQVEKIVSVMNAESWCSYLKRVDGISEQCRRFEGAAPCTDVVWGGWSGKVATTSWGDKILAGARLPPLSPHANEYLMFHGTKPDAADSIARNHFDMAFACKTGFFGAGLYFAESATKSDEYVMEDGHGLYPMIICRVTLGRINYCGERDPITDPGRDALERSCIGGDYHSVLGDRKKTKRTYREFVVYDHYQVYPQFIVWYRRL